MLLGQQIGPFAIESELGSGAMGTVYRAKFTKGDKVFPVALKVVALGLLGNEGAMARFEREANILKQLKHPHIVRLIATGSYKRTPFIAMEFVDGEPLDRVLARRGKLGWEEVVAYGKHLCEALQYAHEKGIIHRDLKPSNLMITRDGVLKLTDFGIAKDTDVTALTGMNSTIGTAAYMSPEQCKGDRNLSNKSDLYSLGVVFFELLTGRKPFQAESTVDMFLKHVNEKPPRVGKIVQDLPTKLESIILQLLEKDKNDRPTDAAWIARMLGEVEEDAFARKSAGLDAATARKIDRPKGPDVLPVDAEDRDAARALKGVKKKKKRKPTVPLHEKKWVKATGILALLVAMGVGVYLIARPPPAEKMFAAIEEEKDTSKKLEAATRYLQTHGASPGEQTDKVAALFRAGKVRERENQLANRLKNALKDKPEENDDPAAYAATIMAIQYERAGDWGNALKLWEQVKASFADESKLPFTLDEVKLAKARWGWLADKRINDIRAAEARGQQLAAKIDENRRFERTTSFDPANPETLAVRALRLERFKDTEKAGLVWDAIMKQPEKDTEQHVWFLLASKYRAGLPKEAVEGGAARRLQLVRAQLTAIESKYLAVKASPERSEWIALRAMCRELTELYDDETDKPVADAVARAKQVLAEAMKAG